MAGREPTPEQRAREDELARQLIAEAAKERQRKAEAAEKARKDELTRRAQEAAAAAKRYEES